MDDRVDRCLRICRRRRAERINNALRLLDRIRATLLWRRLAGEGWWLGGPARFPAGGHLVELEHVDIPEDLDN